MKDRYNIVQVVGDNTTGGVPRHVLVLVQELKKRKHKVSVICPSGPLTKTFRALGVRTEIIAMGSPLDRWADHKIRTALEHIHPDIVHCHGLLGGWLGRLAARKLRNIAVVYTEHFWTPDYHLTNRVWEEFQLRGLGVMDRFTDMTIAVSGTVKTFLVSRNIVPDSKVIVVPNMLSPDFVGLKKYNKPEGVPQIIGSIGSFNVHKGHLMLIEALKILNNKKISVDWRCQFVGSGPLEKTMAKRIIRYRLSSRASLRPPTDDIIEVMRHFSCYVQNSRAEPFGVVVMEAMSLGVPVIATDRGALPEMVRHRETGLVVPYGQPKKLAQAIAKILTDRRLSEELGENARRAVLGKFAIKPVVDRIERVYRKAIRNRQFKRNLREETGKDSPL